VRVYDLFMSPSASCHANRWTTAQGKSTANVRKILQSQKTFANHLDDFLALQQSEAGGGPAAAGANSKRPATNANAAKGQNAGNDEDSHMLDVDDSSRLPPILEPFHGPEASGDNDAPAAPLPGDNDPLLVSRVPEPPSDAELRQLLNHPPLMYLEARGTYDADGQPAKRVFCEICGYWGRVRCMKCGTRVCALDCLETHREECVTRYGL
jgi:zinc finger HIT domain-containing protein 1